MGKQASKHVYRNRDQTEAECFLVNAQLNKAFEEEIWKKTKTGFNLANYNMDHSISELSICLEEKADNNCPLRVDLPPQKSETDTEKVLMFDQNEDKKDSEKTGERGVSQLNIEEFQCGVQFGGGENSKQEWSFTLYDFDGQGKITKEDLASLLKALYDAVGSSIKLPSSGTKTLKLRLTVGQDGSQVTSGGNSPKLKDKDNSKCKDCSKKEISKVKEFSKLNNLTQMPVKCNNNESQGQSQGQCQNLSHPQSTPCAKTRLQLSMIEQQQLVELVQENMERNHIKQLRRHHSDCRGNAHDHSHHKRRHRGHCSINEKNNLDKTTPAVSNNQEDKPKESQDRRNYYLDLAGIENNTSKFQTPVSPTQATAVLNCSPGQHRSRSHDVTQKCDNVKRETERLQKQVEGVRTDHIRSRSFDPQETTVRSPKGHHRVSSSASPHKNGRFRPMSLPAHVPDSMSPHYHRRHRHREKDHDMAMQQVAEWIEREHTCDIEGDRVIIQRHEHHHIHEHHHHHHYHHYYEA